jgi:Flp pilus assembly protein TadG
MGFIQWLQREFARVDRAKRHQQPPISAYYWDGGSPIAREVKDISASGAFLCIPKSERWYPGTVVTVLLQCGSEAAESAETPESVSVPCRVVRHDDGGVGVTFMFSKAEERKSVEQFLRRALGRDVRAKSMPAKDTEGQALVEFALMVPLLFLLIVNMVNFGGFLFAWITVANASRVGAQYAVMGGASVGTPSPATATQIKAVIAQDVFSLLNGSNPTVNVCQNNNGHVTALSGTCTGIASDPEPTTYLLTSVDVYYTYNPLIPLFSFPKLGISATLLPRTIHRRAVMRVIQ